LKYSYQDYVTNGSWPPYSQSAPAGWTGTPWTAFLRSSYMYYPCSRNLNNPAAPGSGYKPARKSTELTADHVALTDLIYDWQGIPHRTGSTPKSLNILWGDGHAFASTLPQLFSNPALWGSDSGGTPYAANVSGQFLKIVSLLTP
jgi:prepilin-type processing-associated H-X9-DG protein